jgi:1-aminocyclopropane-1-carboxylate deaminase/D-cysteine desulfhydrase-like pyridoxal-dependent ACC family enzyme
MEIIKDYKALTPIQEIDDPMFRYVKRDDLFQPFDELAFSGCKIRQVMSLIEDNIDYIKNDCDNNVFACTSVSSPQGAIISRVCKEHDIDVTMFVGGSALPRTLAKNNLMMTAYEYGATINCDARVAFDTAVHAYARQYSQANGMKYFDAGFGVNLKTSPHALIESTAMQVQNIPDDIGTLVVPSGLCIIFAGVVLGCKMFNKNVRRIVCVQIAGYDRTNTINSILNQYGIEDPSKLYDIELAHDYPYSRMLKNFRIDGGNILLDPLYESKGYDYCANHMNINPNENNLLWIAGNSTYVRNHKVPDEIINDYLEENKDYFKDFKGLTT